MSQATRIPVSVRISQEDADFIASLEIEGAATASEKIRALLQQARIEHERETDFHATLPQVQTLLAPAKHAVATWEKDHTEHSALLTRSFEILPDLFAYMASECPAASASKTDFIKYEAAVTQRMAHMMESVLQLAITGSNPCYDENILNHSLTQSLALADIILQQRQSSSTKE